MMIQQSDTGHHHVFDLDIFLDAVMRALAAKTGFLDAAERRYFGGDQAAIDANHAGFQRFRNPPDAAEIAGVEIRSEPVWRLVAHRDHIGLVLEADYRRKRPEGFFPRNKRVRLHIGEHGGFEEGAPERMALAAG